MESVAKFFQEVFPKDEETIKRVVKECIISCMNNDTEKNKIKILKELLFLDNLEIIILFEAKFNTSFHLVLDNNSDEFKYFNAINKNYKMHNLYNQLRKINDIKVIRINNCTYSKNNLQEL